MSRIVVAVRVDHAVKLEKARQWRLWGDQSHLTDAQWLPILAEEFGEVAKAMNENTNLREELVHAAAVCHSWLEAIEKRSL